MLFHVVYGLFRKFILLFHVISGVFGVSSGSPPAGGSSPSTILGSIVGFTSIYRHSPGLALGWLGLSRAHPR
jgi:hypothetical protein